MTNPGRENKFLQSYIGNLMSKNAHVDQGQKEVEHNHNKLGRENKFLQSYIGNLMSKGAHVDQTGVREQIPPGLSRQPDVQKRSQSTKLEGDNKFLQDYITNLMFKSAHVD